MRCACAFKRTRGSASDAGPRRQAAAGQDLSAAGRSARRGRLGSGEIAQFPQCHTSRMLSHDPVGQKSTRRFLAVKWWRLRFAEAVDTRRLRCADDLGCHLQDNSRVAGVCGPTPHLKLKPFSQIPALCDNQRNMCTKYLTPAWSNLRSRKKTEFRWKCFTAALFLVAHGIAWWRYDKCAFVQLPWEPWSLKDIDRCPSSDRVSNADSFLRDIQRSALLR